MKTEQKVIAILAASEPLTANEIARRIGKTAFEIRPLIWRMQATGHPIASHDDGVETVYWFDTSPDGAA